ncbi:MAG TPA: hypothetical protein VGC11_04570, partial [Acidimicrobiia bacterium]
GAVVEVGAGACDVVAGAVGAGVGAGRVVGGGGVVAGVVPSPPVQAPSATASASTRATTGAGAPRRREIRLASSAGPITCVADLPTRHQSTTAHLERLHIGHRGAAYIVATCVPQIRGN